MPKQSASSITNSTPYPHWSFFNFEHQLLVSFAWLLFQTWMEDLFQHPKLVQNPRLIEENISYRLTTSRFAASCSSASLRDATTASPLHAGIYFPSRWTPGWELNIGCHLFSIRSQEHSLIDSILIRWWSIHGFTKCSAHSCLTPHRDTLGKQIYRELDFHCSPVDQSGFEVFGPRIHVSCTEIPQNNVFSANSISIGSPSTNGVPRQTGLRFEFLVSSYPSPLGKFSYLVFLRVMFFWHLTQTNKQTISSHRTLPSVEGMRRSEIQYFSPISL
jgi:hypothetical protein